MMTSFEKVSFDKNGLALTSGNVIIYNFGPSNGFFSSSVDEYIPQGVGLPAYSTLVAPPENVLKKLYFFSAESWHLVEDHRGEIVFDTKTGAAVLINMPGNYPKNTTTMKPLTEYDVWDGSQWITDVAAQHEAKLDSAEKKYTELLEKAKTKISLWQTELQLGMITDKDKTSLIKWLTYISELKKVKTEHALDIIWPLPPREQTN